MDRTKTNQTRVEMTVLPQAKKILLVEDTPINQILVQKLLAKLNQKVVIAENGLEAVEKTEQETFDLIFMDIQMPVMDGLTATRKIRAMGHTMPIIALSAYTLKKNQDDSIAAGCNEFLCKPINKKELHRVLLKWTSQDASSTQEA